MADPTPPPPPGPEAQLAALEAGLKLHQRIEALTAELQRLKWERPDEPTWEDKRWVGLLVGFSLLGACVGFITGLSVQAGITEKLLTGVMTFVSGSLLSYGGFRWRRGIEAPRIDPARVGAGVGGFSAFVIVGVCFGVAARDGQWLVPASALVPVSAGAPPSAAPPGAAPPSATPPSATPPRPDPGVGALRGDASPILVELNAGRPEEARRQCVQALKGELELLKACAMVEKALPPGELDAAALARLGLSLKPGESIFIDLRGNLP